MQGFDMLKLSYDVNIWCDCGTKFNAYSDHGHDVKCPGCGAVYGMLPTRVDGA
jgi:ribosomal protein S27E